MSVFNITPESEESVKIIDIPDIIPMQPSSNLSQEQISEVENFQKGLPMINPILGSEIIQQPEEPEELQLKHEFTPLSSAFIDATLGIGSELSVRWLQVADEVSPATITPWILESTKNVLELSTVIRQSLPIRIVVMGQQEQYIHSLTEEFMLGILSVLHNNTAFSFYIEDTISKPGVTPFPITLADIINNHTQAQDRKYSVDLPIGKVMFNTPDVIQGVSTAAHWLKQDPHNFAKNLYEGNIPLGF